MTWNEWYKNMCDREERMDMEQAVEILKQTAKYMKHWNRSKELSKAVECVEKYYKATMIK